MSISVDDIVRLLNKPLSERIDGHRELIYTDYPPIYEALDPRLEKFFEKHSTNNNKSKQEEGSTATTTSFPAVHIGSGYAAGTVDMALHWQPPLFSKGELVWYPTDWKGKDRDDDDGGGPLEQETRTALRHLIEETQEKKNSVLFIDRENEKVFKDDAVELFGLKAAQFNGRRGCIRGPDPKTPGRFAVQLSPDPKDVRSFKQENINYAGEVTGAGLMLRKMREEGKDEEFYEGLLERSRELDILKHETWSGFDDLIGKCALVTCTSLLSCLGYRDPTAWQDTMEFASKVLHKAGFLVQFDPVGYAGYGDAAAMQSFVQDRSLGFILQEDIIPPDSNLNDGSPRKLLVWQKA